MKYKRQNLIRDIFVIIIIALIAMLLNGCATYKELMKDQQCYDSFITFKEYINADYCKE